MPISEMQKLKHGASKFTDSEGQHWSLEAPISSYFVFLGISDGNERQKDEVMLRSTSTSLVK